MQYATLGRTGLIVSRMALGTMTFGASRSFGLRFNVDQKGADLLVARAMDAGVNFFDTADMYATGQAEEILGHALGKRRKEVVISTKVAARMGYALVRAGLSYRRIIEAAEESTKRLKTDYIDLYFAHIDDRLTPFEETARAFDHLVRRGMVRYVGFSNYPAWKAALATGILHEHDYAPFASAQMHYCLTNRDIEHEMIPFLEQTGIGLMVWSPLSSGFLSGKYTRRDPTGGGGRRGRGSFNFPPIDLDASYDLMERIRAVADGQGVTPAQLSLAWLLSKAVVTSAILGVTKPEQLDENLKAADLAISGQGLEALNELTAPSPLYPNWMYAGPFDPKGYEALFGKSRDR
jgi:aryl-alcohol dehydrogenase-like predicted oxidoreductase